MRSLGQSDLECQNIFFLLSWKPFISESSYFTCRLVMTSRWLLLILGSVSQMSRSQWPWMLKWVSFSWKLLIIPNNVSHSPGKGGGTYVSFNISCYYNLSFCLSESRYYSLFCYNATGTFIFYRHMISI